MYSMIISSSSSIFIYNNYYTIILHNVFIIFFLHIIFIYATPKPTHVCVSMLQRRALEDLVGARLSQHFEVERNIKGRGTMSGRQSKSSTPATSRPRSMQEARKSVKRSSSSRKAIRDKREEDVYKPDLSLVDNIIESRNSRIRSENKQHRLKSREKSTSKSRRQHSPA